MTSKSAQFFVVIPARYSSVRLPGKPLLDIAGKPMVQHVYERACESGAAGVIVATDDERIQQACQEFGAHVCMTSPDHQSGTDRVAEVAGVLRWADDDIVVNVQGDEPLLPPEAILQVANVLHTDSACGMATLCTPIDSLRDFLNPDVVKVVADNSGKAIFFSRAPVPWNRAGATDGLDSQISFQGANRHIGLYAYRVSSLKSLSAASPCDWEQLERLEQLRALWLGIAIRVAAAVEIPAAGVDNADDLEAVRRVVQEQMGS